MLSVDFIKQYLYIPAGLTEDDHIIEQFIEMARMYLKGAIDNFEAKYEALADFRKQSDQFMLLYVAELYQNRNMYAEGAEPSYNVKALMLQLQTTELSEEE